MSASKDAKPPEVCGVWVVEKVLGKGAFGIVKLWKNKETSEKFALKSCRHNPDEGPLAPKHIERWKKEVDIMSKLDHKAVVKCFDVPQELVAANKGLPMLCMEYCQGGDLRKILNKAENCCGLQEPAIRLCLSHVTGAISYLHSRGITHRDLKPENIVLHKLGQVVYKIIDLGYAKELEKTSAIHSFVGTDAYLAPELSLRDKYTCTVDYWSLGLVTHEIITGSRPFESVSTNWKRIEDKNPNDICAYKDRRGNLQFSSEMVPEIHISLPFKKRMEDWLKIMLAWNPTERGHIKKSHGELELVAFSKMNECLKQKVVKVFVVEKFKLLDYEVSESTSMQTLQLWIERDTNVLVDNQKPLLVTGHSPDPQSPATQCCSQAESQDDVMEFVLYIFSESVSRHEIDPKIPPLVEEMIKSKRPFEHSVQKRMYAHSLLFLQHESHLFTLLTQAQKVYMLALKMKSKEIAQAEERMRSDSTKLTARHDMFMEILDQDRSSYEELNSAGIMSCPSLYKSWMASHETILAKHDTVVEKVQNMQELLNAFQTKVLELQRSPFSNSQLKPPLAELVLKAEALYSTNVRQKQQNPQEEIAPFMMLFREAFMLRKRLHKELYTHISKQFLCFRESQTLMQPLEDILEELARVAQLISSEQSRNQSYLWKVMEKTMATTQSLAGVTPVPRNPPRAPIPSTASQSLETLLNSSCKQSSSLIAENRDLRIRLISELSPKSPSQKKDHESPRGAIPKILGSPKGVETSL